MDTTWLDEAIDTVAGAAWLALEWMIKIILAFAVGLILIQDLPAILVGLVMYAVLYEA